MAKGPAQGPHAEGRRGAQLGRGENGSTPSSTGHTGRLPPRLAALAGAVTAHLRSDPQSTVADVATGRGELAVWLAQTGAAGRVVASDRSSKAVTILQGLLAQRGLADLVEARHGDGLEALAPGEAGVIVIAGIGGRLAVELLARGAGRLAGNSHAGQGYSGPQLVGSRPVLIVQPMSRAELVREWAYGPATSLGYGLEHEFLVEDSGRFYHVFVIAGTTARALLAAPGVGCLTAEQVAALRAVYAAGVLAEVGFHLLAQPDPALGDYLRWRLKALDNLAEAAGASPSRRGLAQRDAALSLAAGMRAALRIDTARRIGNA